MPAYWVARSKINDPIEYKKYTDLVPGIIAKFGGSTEEKVDDLNVRRDAVKRVARPSTATRSLSP